MLKKFDLTTTTDNAEGLDFQIIRIHGYLDSSTFQELQDHLQGLIDQGNIRLIIDFDDLNYISSAGLGVLMGMLQEVRQKQGDLKLIRMSPKIRNLFDMLGFSRMIEIYQDVNEAKQAFLKDKSSSAQSDEEIAEENY